MVSIEPGGLGPTTVLVFTQPLSRLIVTQSTRAVMLTAQTLYQRETLVQRAFFGYEGESCPLDKGRENCVTHVVLGQHAAEAQGAEAFPGIAVEGIGLN